MLPGVVLAPSSAAGRLYGAMDSSAQPTSSAQTSMGAPREAPVATRLVSWMFSGALVVAQVATVLASSRTTWFGWLCVSTILFGCVIVSRFVITRRTPNSASHAEFAVTNSGAPADRHWQWFTLSAMTLILLAGLVKAPHRSADVYAYGAYGQIVSEHSASPYATRPSAFPDDPVIDRMAKGWRNTRSVYGPAFTALSALGMRMAGTSAWIERLWFQALAALATGFSALLLKRLSPGRWWMFALNPVTMIVVSHEGHNDALVGLGILSALWFLGRASAAGSRPSPYIHGAMGSFVFAASIKITAILAVPAMAIWIVRHVGWKQAARVGAPWALVCGGLFAATGGPSAFEAFRGLRTFRSTTSLWHLHWIRTLTDSADAKPGVLALTIPAAALAMVGLLVVWKSWQSRQAGMVGHAFEHDGGDSIHIHTYGISDLPTRTVLPLVVFITLGLYILPWYWGWLLAPAILLPTGLRNAVLFCAAAHTLAYGAGTQLYDNFATMLSTARFVTPMAFVVVLAIAVFVVWRGPVHHRFRDASIAK
jgi:hypothetical protein